ncbi:DUF1501 domain-containing protein [Micromonospora sp. HM5-17]|jgi:uncharacterized protein (DUF1501 family)|uniref:DUF1501 domain-containing protein n=1 Tax=Micromonospora sp. HM5-17 TaxID=2487710 RepID=UPI000F4819BE|nr:DUF1501 domain-containing protein [Micromonospora sp. HM5-17]ROT28226.1 DUF1501 domain-containing protein [Micromonospora sp. HM5-17]
MDILTRRRFLLASGVVGAGALAAGAGALGLAELLKTASGGTSDASARKLVLVTLYGGNDGLNTVVPFADPAYHSARPELAYAPEEVLHLDDTLGLNPMLTGLKKLWDDKRLAIVLGVGYPRPDRSHFRSMDIWQTASPVNPVQTGWVGRWLDGTSAPPEAAVSFEPVLPPMLAGETRAGSCVSPSGLSLPNGITPEMLAALGQPEDGEPTPRARAASAYTDLLHVEHLIREAEKTPRDPAAGPELELLTTGTGRTSSLSTQLALVARCVEAGVPTRVYSVSLDGFDTHADERAGHESLLKRLDDALSGFVNRMSRTEAGRQVTVLVYSEFGRRVRANASDGTDHGTAAPVFVLGPRVAGGFYGEQPSLTDLDDGDLKANLDLRTVIGTMLHSVLDVDPGQYLDGFRTDPLPLLPAV